MQGGVSHGRGQDVMHQHDPRTVFRNGQTRHKNPHLKGETNERDQFTLSNIAKTAPGGRGGSHSAVLKMPGVEGYTGQGDKGDHTDILKGNQVGSRACWVIGGTQFGIWKEPSFVMLVNHPYRAVVQGGHECENHSKRFRQALPFRTQWRGLFVCRLRRCRIEMGFQQGRP